jgi:hypothetical protein
MVSFAQDDEALLFGHKAQINDLNFPMTFQNHLKSFRRKQRYQGRPDPSRPLVLRPQEEVSGRCLSECFLTDSLLVRKNADSKNE